MTWKALLALLLMALPAAAASPDPRIADWAWDRTQGGASAEVLVILREKADLSGIAQIDDRLDRRRFVWMALHATADGSQRDLLRFMDERSIEHRSFYLINALWARVDRAALIEIAARPDVERVVGNPVIHNILPPEATAGLAMPKAAEWGVQRVGAPAAWADGWFGQGIVVGIQDTGVRYTHEAVVAHYRGYDAGSGTWSHDYNWHDSIHSGGNGGACGVDSPVPCDDQGHGTHVTGTSTGGDPSGDALGVAPGAKWIGCRNMDQGFGTPSSYIECFEFMLAPWPIAGTPADGDPDLGADLTSNSWICPPSEGCAWDVLEAAVAAQRLAGIMPVVAAGNAGGSCGSVGIPPAIYDESYTVGAIDSGDNMAGFSSRGPAADTGVPKPDIVAPGVGVRSSTAGSDSEYGSWSGTSMATPHVAGAVALLWSARPTYRGRVAETEDLLNRTADRLPAIVEGCGGDYVDGPNNTWGHGVVDVARAIAEACIAPESGCTDLFDNDCDGLEDCADPDCDGDAACPESSACTDGRDNDLDGAPDCADPDCDGNAACPESSACTDGRDNDLDGAADCADADCDGNAACPESAACTDGRDNDLDGTVDCADPDCDGNAACPESSACTDGRDNDLDGAVDCADADCDGNAACPESAACTDGRDNDLDGATDCADADCDGNAACPESAACADGRDNDLDGATDCLDVECVGDASCANADFDLDGSPNAVDCLPLDGGVFAPAGDVARLDVTRAGAAAALSWTSVAAASGTATTYDVASDTLAQLRALRVAAGACIAVDGISTALLDPRAAPDGLFYLIRAVTPCGQPAPWGQDSLGMPEPGCR
jgi:subtilisin family serine protease